MKKPLNLKNLASCFAGFCLFSLLYFLPTIMYGLETAVEDDRVSQLINAVLSRPHARLQLIKNLSGHLLLIAGYFSLLWIAGRGLSTKLHVSPTLGRTLALTLGWVLLVSGNAHLYPGSTYTFSFPFLAQPILALSLAAALSFLVLWELANSNYFRQFAFASVSIIAIVAAISNTTAVFGSTNSNKRNVIIIGVDSLSYAAMQRLREKLPTLNSLMAQGTTYDRAYTPLARTFPSWMSILSGKQPAEHGAVFNLRSMDHVTRNDLISLDLQQQNFHTVYAIDERRFNNIDKSFGFDDVVGPEAGALDFVLQQVNDTPLSNLFVQLPIAGWLFPFTYTNTESAVNYDATGFVNSILSTTEGPQPLFLATHFESAHYPFETRHAVNSFQTDNTFWNKHAAALTVVDRQIAQLLAGLKKQGRLNNTLVIVLSDHGEGLGYKEADFSIPDDADETQNYGHGTSLASDHQNHIVLSTTEFRNGAALSTQKHSNKQVSLLDLHHTIMGYIDTGRSNIEPKSECLIVETGLRFGAAADYRKLDAAALAASTASFYEIDPQGRLRLKDGKLRELIETKDIGWRCADHITYFSDYLGKYLSIQLDADGLPTAQVPTIQNDVAKIEQYKKALLTQVQG